MGQDRKIKIRKSDLKKVLRGQLSLNEAKARASRILVEDVPAVSATNPEMLENDSLDSQIDRFLMQGESNKAQEEMGMTPPGQEATTQESYNLDLDVILEVGEDPAGAAPPDPGAAAGAPPGGDAPANPPPQEPAQKTGKELDAMTFADNVARLVEHSDNLLDIKGTIVRRALNWVTKNYDAKQSKEVQQILEGNFGISPTNDSDPYEDDMAPPAAGAGSGLNA